MKENFDLWLEARLLPLKIVWQKKIDGVLKVLLKIPVSEDSFSGGKKKIACKERP
jgi:hypothetical protein